MSQAQASLFLTSQT